jgi:drug/metabolite transporter (DMT)-like permease
MRLVFGAVFIWVLALVWGRAPQLSSALRDKGGISNTLAGAVVGPFLGITLSMVAVTFTETGVAQTLMSLMPVLIIPIVWILYRQRTSWRGILGAVIAVIGVAIIFMT